MGATRQTLDAEWLGALVPPVLSPRVFRAVLPIVPAKTYGLEYERAAAMKSAYEACEADLTRFPELADVGFAMLSKTRSVEERRQACVWLTLFPSEEMVDTLARVLLDDGDDAEVRSQAAWSLGFRQAQERHPGIFWDQAAIARADDALLEAWQRGLSPKLERLALATRHVDDPRLFEWMREQLAASQDVLPALEAFATPALAQALLDGLEALPAEHTHRMIRLAAHVLGAGAASRLVEYAAKAPFAPGHEALFCALSVDPERAREAVDAAIAAMAFPAPAHARRDAFLATPGSIPFVRALRVARTTAAIDPAARPEACRAAAADFALLGRADAIHEAYLHALWRHVAYGARDVAPDQVVACVEVSPRALQQLPALAEPYVVGLCAAGRFRDASRVAADVGVATRAAWELARVGRPFTALRLAGTIRERTLGSSAAEALAAFLVGRPDLAGAALEAFAADDQTRWAVHDAADPIARAVLDRDVTALLSRCVAAPAGADADEIDLACVQELERRLVPRLDGLCVYLAGFGDAARTGARHQLTELGARVVDAPFGAVDLCVVPDDHPADAPVDPRLVVRSVPVFPLSRVLRGAPPTERTKDSSMPRLQRPYRVILLAPVLELGEPDRVVNGRIADLLGALVASYLVRHPAIAFFDPSSQHFHDGLGNPVGERTLFNRNAQSFQRILGIEFGDDRRDEVFWFELVIDPQKPVSARLVTLRAGQQQPETFAAIGSGALSQMFQHCFDQWLQARQLPPGPDVFPPFSVQDFMTAARMLVQADQLNDTGQDMARVFDSFQGPLLPAFVAAGFKMIIMNDLHRRLVMKVLQQVPQDPQARRIEWLYRSNEGKANVAELKQISQTAPNWSFPYMSLRGKGVSDDEALRNQLMATFLTPGNDGGWMGLAWQFDNTSRYDAAWRVADRMIGNDPADAGLYLAAVSFLRQTQREGDAFREAIGRYAQMMRQSQEGSLNVQGFTQVQAAEFKVAQQHVEIGRLDEGIALGAKAIGEDDGQRLQYEQKQLKEWRANPDMVGNAYAREGYFRGDPARVLEGFGRGKPRYAGDVAMIVDALIALGDEKVAPLAYAHMLGAGITGHPISRLAGVRALVAGGEPLGVALEHLQIAVLREPDAQIEPEVERLLRLAATRPLPEWEQYIGQRRSTGALRLARMAARDAADFVPGADQSPVVRDALGPPAGRTFDPAWLAALKASFEGVPPERLAAVDAYFAERAQPTLAVADKLPFEWSRALAPEDDQGSAVRTAETLLYFAHALTRYFAATATTPSVLAGGYRRLATLAHLALTNGGGAVKRSHVRGLLQAIEASAAGVDPWVLDSFILRIERLWNLEVREGDLRPMTDGLPIVGDLLRGTETIGLEYRHAHALKDANASPADACALFERSVRALGKGDAFKAWSEVAVLAMQPAQALDVHWTCALANTGNAVPWINVAKGAFAVGLPDVAFEALVRAFPPTGKDWRNARLAELRPLWEQARVQVPFEFNAAASASMSLMQQGQFEAALKPTRWCDAIDPNNATTKRNLGIIYARLGRAYDSALAFSQGDKEQGPTQAGHALREANQVELALRAYRYAATSFRTPDEWALLGGVAWQAEDDRTGAMAYEQASDLARGQLKSSQLNAWATTLLGLGNYERARTLLEEIMRRNDDPSIAPYVLHSMAQVLLGLGRPQEAVNYAQAAIQRAPQQSAQEFGVTMQHAQRGQPLPLKAQPPSAAAFDALRASDIKAAADLAGKLPSDARATRVALTASRYRFPTDNETAFTRGATDAAWALIQAAAGTTDLDGALALYDATRTTASAAFGIDPPPPMGASLTRDAFRARFATAGQPAGMAQAQAAAQAGAAGDMDPVVFPGQRVAKLSDYVHIMRGMQSGNPMGALAQMGLDMQSYGQVAMQWAQAMQRDPTLVAKFQRMMTQ